MPDPLTPVTQTSAPSGNETLSSLRLLAVAPSMEIALRWLARRRLAGAGIEIRPDKYWPVIEPAVPPGAGANVDQVIGLAHDRLVVFDDQHAIALVLEVAQRLDQAPVVARMQADRGFVADIADADEPRADAGRQADTL